MGLDYLTLGRPSATLSGGESERIRLATQIGSGLVGVLYIFDEPSIGLHQRDNARLLSTLKKLRDLGNTILVVEHDEETILESDYVLDLGPGAGVHGGEVVFKGTPQELLRAENSLTGRYLSGRLKIPLPEKRRKAGGKYLTLVGAGANNLKDIMVRIPLGLFTCVTGVSGSGKSTLILDTLFRALAQKIYHSKERPGKIREIQGHCGDRQGDPDRPIAHRSHARGRIRPLTPGSLPTSGTSSPSSPNRGPAATAPAGIASTSRGGDARPAGAMGSSKSKCISCPTST